MVNVQPTRVRYFVLFLVCLLSMITYLDRACFGVAAPILAKEMGYSGVSDLKWAITAFAIAYAVFEIPTGWLGDRLGPRSTLIRIVAWWSFFTALTGMVGMKIGTVVFGGLGTLITIRFLFGMGEAGAYPNITRAIHNWFPLKEWSIAQGFVWMSGRLMGGLTPLVWAFLVAGTATTEPVIDWRQAFYLFGFIGILWCVVFAIFFRNWPAEDPRVNDAERQLIDAEGHADSTHAIPWRAMLTSPHLWLICVMYFCVSYGWYFNITYMAEFMKLRYAVEDKSLLGAIYKGGPLWVGAFGCIAGGAFSEYLSRRLNNRRLARRLLCVTCQALCVACWLSARTAPTPFTFFLACSGAALFTDLTLATVWASVQDIGRRFPAVAAGWMNMMGNLGGAASGWLTGAILQAGVARHAESLGQSVATLAPQDLATGNLHGYSNAFLTYAAVYAVAATCWMLLDSTTPIGLPTHKPTRDEKT